MSGKTQHLENDDDRSSGLVFYGFLGSHLIAASLFVATILGVPVSMMSDQPIELALQTVHQDDESWKDEDIHTDFALDDREFKIEPAAGPLALD